MALLKPLYHPERVHFRDYGHINLVVRSLFEQINQGLELREAMVQRLEDSVPQAEIATRTIARA